jgi:tetratricopeptide (TPR) repeat protein
VDAAYAEPPPRKPTSPVALDHFTRAARLFGNQEWDEAIKEFKESGLTEPSPATHFNLAICYRLLGEKASKDNGEPTTIRQNYEAAIWHYEQFIKASPETPERADEVRKLIDNMRSEIAKLPTSKPQPVHELRRAETKPEPFYRDAVAWALTGAGVATLGVSGGLFWSASNLRDDANATPDQKEQNSLRDRADTRSLLGTTLAIVGGGLLVGGVIKLIVHDSDPGKSSMAFGVSDRGIVVFGRF